MINKSTTYLPIELNYLIWDKCDSMTLCTLGLVNKFGYSNLLDQNTNKKGFYQVSINHSPLKDKITIKLEHVFNVSPTFIKFRTVLKGNCFCSVPANNFYDIDKQNLRVITNSLDALHNHYIHGYDYRNKDFFVTSTFFGRVCNLSEMGLYFHHSVEIRNLNSQDMYGCIEEEDINMYYQKKYFYVEHGFNVKHDKDVYFAESRIVNKYVRKCYPDPKYNNSLMQFQIKEIIYSFDDTLMFTPRDVFTPIIDLSDYHIVGTITYSNPSELTLFLIKMPINTPQRYVVELSSSERYTLTICNKSRIRNTCLCTNTNQTNLYILVRFDEAFEIFVFNFNYKSFSTRRFVIPLDLKIAEWLNETFDVVDEHYLVITTRKTETILYWINISSSKLVLESVQTYSNSPICSISIKGDSIVVQNACKTRKGNPGHYNYFFY